MVGGESGLPSVVPRKPDESPLLLATLREHGDWEAMPPKGARQAKRRTTACAAAPPTAATTTPMR